MNSVCGIDPFRLLRITVEDLNPVQNIFLKESEIYFLGFFELGN